MSRVTNFLLLSVLVALLMNLHSMYAGPPAAAPSAAAAQHPVAAAAAAAQPSDGCVAADGPSFWASGLAAGTDKVSKAFNTVVYKGEKYPTHAFQFAYEKYLRPRRCERMKLLEIGLGCGFSPWKSALRVFSPLLLPRARSSALTFPPPPTLLLHRGSGLQHPPVADLPAQH